MQNHTTVFGVRRAVLLGCTALVSVLGISGTASASEAAAAQATADSQSTGVGEIIVTAQKRSQNLQDVPIAMTALDSKALEANRITSTVDLGAVVPNLAARNTGGGAMLPAFTMRGVTSYGVVPGSDKEISVYIDGVYQGSTVGSALDLPEVSQIEVLRGPQGVNFGRNATGGAISVITRDPPSKFGLSQEFTVGNYNEFRSKTRIDTGAFGDFSASVSFLHDERRGDIYNLGAGTVWTYPAGLGIPTTQVSPAYLGDKNLNSVFVAVKYEPNSNFKVINKFDWTGNHYTPTGAAAVGYFPGALGPYGAQYAAVLATQAPGVPLLDPTAVRPDAVNNSFTTPSYDKDWGDSLTATYRVSSDLSFKNILAYRASYLESADQIGGQGDLVITQATINAGVGFTQSDLGSHYAPYAIEQIERSHQWSDELQGNYNSKYLTLTAGVMYFHLTTQNGGLVGFPNDVALENIPGNSVANIPGSSPATAYNDATSVAGYVQAEGHITSQLDVVAGFRETNDAKSGSFIGYSTPVAFSYNKTLPAYSGGLNFKPTRDLMIYGKYSRAFVSGGAAGTVVFQPETARSWEAGFKSDWFDHRLRANLAVYTVSYDDLQAASAGINVGHPELGLVVVDQGNVRAKGFEFESTMVPVKGVTLGFAAGYTDVKFTYLNPGSGQGALGQPAALNNFFPTLQPKWTSTMSAEYDTPPVFGDSNMTFRLDASWRDKELTDPFLAFQQLPMYKSLLYSPATWLINGRVSLDHIKLPYGEGQIALWVKNLGNAKESVFPDIFGFLGVTEFQAARTFGLDVNFKM